MNISQIMIFIFGAAGIWFVSRKESWKKWGFVFGLVAQPFWFYVTWKNQQWGMFCLTIFYTYSWLQGIYNYFIKK
jgi:nicotinamide riboside transporter PnuC